MKPIHNDPPKKPYIPSKGVPHEVIGLWIVNQWSLLKAWRKYLGVSRKDMADRLKIKRSQYVRMEKRKAKLKKSTKAKIAHALGLKIGQVFT